MNKKIKSIGLAIVAATFAFAVSAKPMLCDLDKCHAHGDGSYSCPKGACV
jgi:hypothetical protein